MSPTPAGPRPTSTDVAKLSGVSRATVSYVLNRHPGQTISESTRRRVFDAAETLGYVPSALASSLRRGRSNVVLLSLDPLFAGHVSDLIVDSATARLQQEGYVVVRHSHVDPQKIVEIAQALSVFAVVSLSFLTADLSRRLLDVGVKRILALEAPADSAGPPDRPWELPIGQLQVDHLVEVGYDRLVYALPLHSPRLPIAMARLRGVQIECINLGVEQPTIIELPLDRREIAKTLLTLDRLPGRTALCAYEDQIGIGVLGAMNDLGWKVRDDLGVIGCDDLPVASLVTPSLTTVVTDASLVGVAAAERFLQLRDGEISGGPIDDELEYSVVVRQST